MTTPEAQSTETPLANHELSFDSKPIRSRDERLAAGKAIRERVPLMSHAVWNPPQDRRDVIEILEESNVDRLPELIPLRYGRMVASPFTFLRGSAALMAYDLSKTPITGERVQACGDCHLLNFGLFATPERNLVFDINDFDETLPGPWEWDVKRLAISFVVAGLDQAMTKDESLEVAIESVRSYREHLRDYSSMSALELWYDRLDDKTLIELAPNDKARKLREDLVERARKRTIDHLFPKLVLEIDNKHRFADTPPVLYHVSEPGFEANLREGMNEYRMSLPDDRRVLLDRYHLEDFAVKVVGVGSVGTRCYVALAYDDDGHPLILQIKEARQSVLAPYAGRSVYENQGHRIVNGQRLTHSSTDIFLGWIGGGRENPMKDFYVRQLRDMKMSLPIEDVTPIQLKHYAEVCGWTLARSHAKTGDAATISGYLGQKDTFDEAIGAFALAYADQNEADHAKLVDAIKSGRLEALFEDEN
jgi:uncharacterized protein (DUF2252 family)